MGNASTMARAADLTDEQGHEIYDHMAPYYRAYAEKKSAYINEVNAIICEYAPTGTKSMLDIGAGDGVRAVNVAQQIGVDHLVLLEPSREMAKLCQGLPVAAVWNNTSDELPDRHAVPFHLATAMWNVLGHIPNRTSRVRALKKTAALLAPGGRIILDVNNRHNASAYGTARVFARRVIDSILPDERRGDIEFFWTVEDRKIPAKGHLFTPREMAGIIRDAGLKISRIYAVDYMTGRRTENLTAGQLVYILERP